MSVYTTSVKSNRNTCVTHTSSLTNVAQIIFQTYSLIIYLHTLSKYSQPLLSAVLLWNLYCSDSQILIPKIHYPAQIPTIVTLHLTKFQWVLVRNFNSSGDWMLGLTDCFSKSSWKDWLIPEGTLGTLCPLKYKGGGAVCIACMYVGCLVGGIEMGWECIIIFPIENNGKFVLLYVFRCQTHFQEWIRVG